jgi:putative addiction module component (TIGR02574 family)
MLSETEDAMPANLESLGLDRLSPDEQLDLVHALWNHIAATRPKPLLTDAQRQELRRRIAEDDSTPDDVVPWEQVKAEARARHGR